MAVIRIHKTENYTVMSNAHFKERKMSLKAKGLLSMMFSLPDDWDYSVMGLVTLSKDGKDSVIAALKEIENFGYLIRTQLTDENGRFAGYDYDIYENPQKDIKSEKPYAENPNTVNPNAENPPQLNTNKSIPLIIQNNNIEKERKSDTPVSNSFDLLIDDYLEKSGLKDNPDVEGLLKDWLKVRKAKRAAMTDRAIELNLKKLDEVAAESNMTVASYLEEVICRGWQAFYPIKNYENNKSGHQGGSGGGNVFLDLAKDENLF